MTPRATDWGLALLVGLLFVTGVMTLFAGTPGERWVFVLHGAGGFALGAFLGWKLRRVHRRLLDPSKWDGKTGAAVAAVLLVGTTLVTGWLWSTGVNLGLAGYNLLAWHFALGAVLTLAVGAHMLARAKPPRRADFTSRRQFLKVGLVAAGGYAAYQAQRPLSAWVGLRGHKRRFTGSYEKASFAGNDFPSTSWVADDPVPTDPAAYRLRIGDRELTAAELDAGDEFKATLDCTGGFHSTQRWRGTRLDRLLEEADGSHIRVISKTGYRWSFDRAEAKRLLLATHVGGEPISHDHGAPARLVAPGHRGFHWVKWVERIELTDGPDPGALASTVWSSFTDKGRGAS